MNVDVEEFAKIKNEAEKFYRSLGDIQCPYFKELVAFNDKGLNHIKFKEWNKTRIIDDQYFRLKFLHLAPEVIRKSHTLQESREAKNFERQKINSRWEQRLITVKYYAFVAILEDVRVKVVVKEIEGGKKCFWSICPYWKQRKDNDGKTKKVLHEGNLETQ